MTDETVSAGFARGLLEFAVAKGAPREKLLEAVQLSDALLADQDARVPFSSYVTLMRTAKSLTGDEALALHFGEAVNVATVSIVGLIGQASATLLDAFMQLSRYVRLIVDVELAGPDRFSLQREHGALWIVDARARPNDFPELTESAFSQIVSRPRAAGALQWVREVHVTHDAPGYRAEYERVFQAPVTFGAPWNAMRVDEAIFAHRVEILPRYVFGVLTDRADALLSELERNETTRGAVERLLMPVLHTGEIGVAAIAEQLGVSRQTLYRNLKAEGVTFEQVLDALRYKMALHYLRGRKVSVHDTAYLVGFSDPTSFSRAFKRWTGKSPSEARDED